ncbi:MAG: electron transport complex subunit RsxC [Thiomicrospira sp.]
MSLQQSIRQSLVNLIAPLYPMAKRWLYHFHGGVFPKYNKSLSLRQPLRRGFMPKQLILPLQQHMGAPAVPCVQVGDQVKKYQLIAQADKGLSVPVHAPTSGTIIALEQRILPHASGLAEPCIVIAPDGKDDALTNPLNRQQPPQTIAEFKQLILDAGIVGMGGAGFPTFAKLPNQPGLVQHLIINGAECEPFITCDDLLMQTHASEIIRAAQFIADLFAIAHVVCGIETNKPEAIKAMRQACQGTNIEVVEVATVYPMGGQKQLTQELLNIEISTQKHSIDVGVVMMNVATLRAITQAIDFGQPLVSRFVTVSGMGLKQPFNIDALLGTPFNELVTLAQPEPTLDYPLLMGGPMMGFAVANNDVPVIKTTNCILANPPQAMQDPMACIRCGECAEACPINLLPQQLYWHAKAHEFEQAEKLNLFDCIECGCCSFVCPSRIPLVQYYRHAKAEVRELKAQAALTEQAKQRHDARVARLEREKQEREAKIAAKKAAVKQQAATEQTANNSTAADTTTTLSAREKAIQAAKARQAAAKKLNPEGTKDTKILEAHTEEKTEVKTELTVEDKRKAAIEAAKARAAAKKLNNEGTKISEAHTEEKTEVKTELTVEDKRKAAMEAAKARAAARKQQMESNNE